MKIVAVSCVKDVLDIVEAFVRHTLTFVERLVVLDNGSTDGTLAILKALRQEGLPLDVVEDPSSGQYQAKRMTRLMRERALAIHRADWVLMLDADEFVMTADSQPLIPDDAAIDKPLELNWRTYVPTTDDDVNETNPVRRLRHRLANEGWPFVKVLVPAALGGLPGAAIRHGNHGLAVEGKEVAGVAAPHAFLAHFPVRTPGQYIAKTVIGFLQLELMIDRDPAAGFQYRDNFEQLRSDPTGFVRDFADAARRYSVPVQSGDDPPPIVEDPFPYRGGPLQHTPPLDDAVRTWQPILDYARALVGELGLLKASISEDGRLCMEQQARMWTDLRDHLMRQDSNARERHGQVMALRQQVQNLTQRLQVAQAELQKRKAGPQAPPRQG